jgi:Domain of unknown function (DUF4349)
MGLRRDTTPASGTGRRRVRRAAAPAAAAVLLVGLTACGSSTSSDSSSGGSTAAVAPEQGGVARGADTSTVKGAGSTVQTRAVIMTGRVSLESKSLTTVRADVDRLVARYGGYVDREDTVDDSHGRVTSSTLQLRIPSGSFDAVMAAFKGIATVTSTNRQAEDVTTEVIDVEARVRTAEVSLRRLRSFLGKATNVDSVIRLESEITQREADLASLRSQQRYLRNQTSLATITVSMTRTGKTAEEDPLAHAGFLTGLRNGWQALLNLGLVAATVAGALLPFALVLALLLVPLTLLLRSARARSRSVAPAGPDRSTAAPRDRG